MVLTKGRSVTIGITAIDGQHRELIATIQALGAPDSQLNHDPIQVLRLVQRHVLVHFADEEKAMQAAGYDGLQQHSAEHRRLSDDVAALSVEIVNHGPDPDLLSVANRLLCNRLLEHIDTSDRAFAEFLAAKAAADQ